MAQAPLPVDEDEISFILSQPESEQFWFERITKQVKWTRTPVPQVPQEVIDLEMLKVVIKTVDDCIDPSYRISGRHLPLRISALM